MGVWIQTRSGRRLYPFEPFRNEYEITDIAHALGNICRFGGHSRVFYSVAQHSVLVSLNVSSKSARWGLLHDAAEAFFGDMPTPIKSVLPDYAAAERRLALAISDAFDAAPSPEIAAEVKIMDRRLFWDESLTLMEPLHPEFKPISLELGYGRPKGLGLSIEPVGPDQGADLFLSRFRELWS